MSLGDRYNRGGGRFDNLDRYLTHLGNRVGNAWLDKTGVGRHVLTQGLYLFAAWAALQSLVLSRDPFMLIFAGQALLGLMGVAQSRGGLVEQIQVEAMGLPKSTFAFLRLFILAIGCMALATAAGELGVALQNRSALPPSAADSMITGLALVSLQVGDYIRRTNPPTWSRGLGTRN